MHLYLHNFSWFGCGLSFMYVSTKPKKGLCRNPVLKEQSHRRQGRMLLSSGLFFPSKNPCENSGTPEPATSPVIPHFPHPPNFRGHNSEKCGTGLELFNDFRWERMRSNIEMLRRPKAGWDVVWDAAGTGGGYSSILPGRHQG